MHINGTFNLLCRIVFRGAGQCFCRTCMVGRGGMEVAGVPSRGGLERAGRDGLERTGTGGAGTSGAWRTGTNVAGRTGTNVAGRKTCSCGHTSATCYLLSVTCYLLPATCSGPSASTGFHPIASRHFHKLLTINKLPQLTLRLGASKSTQRQPCFCKLLIISGSRK